MIVNAAEGEPGSAKDSALMITAPHLVLDGAELVAGALGTKTIRVVVPRERASVQVAVEDAVAERGDFRYEVYETGGGFVGGQAYAVMELIEGRENLPVSSWQPAAVAGLRGRPTLLSNAETYAQVATLHQLGPTVYAREGTDEEPGTTLVTVAGDGPGGVVIEVPHGAALADVLQRCGYDADVPVLIGGYHGAWLPPDQVMRRTLTRADLKAAGATLGAGVILPLDHTGCPVVLTARIVEYLAGQSARRCGPCKLGLPELADAALRLAAGGGEHAQRPDARGRGAGRRPRRMRAPGRHRSAGPLDVQRVPRRGVHARAGTVRGGGGGESGMSAGGRWPPDGPGGMGPPPDSLLGADTPPDGLPAAGDPGAQYVDDRVRTRPTRVRSTRPIGCAVRGRSGCRLPPHRGPWGRQPGRRTAGAGRALAGRAPAGGHSAAGPAHRRGTARDPARPGPRGAAAPVHRSRSAAAAEHVRTDDAGPGHGGPPAAGTEAAGRLARLPRPRPVRRTAARAAPPGRVGLPDHRRRATVPGSGGGGPPRRGLLPHARAAADRAGLTAR